VNPETQTILAPGAGWLNFGNGFQVLGYETIGTRAFLRGLITNTLAITNGGPSVMLGIPPGLRPAVTEMFNVIVNGATAYRVDVRPDGTVALYGNLPVNSYISMSGITYSTLT